MSDFFSDLFSKPGHAAPVFSPMLADSKETKQPDPSGDKKTAAHREAVHAKQVARIFPQEKSKD